MPSSLLPLPRSLSLTRCVTISLLPFNKVFKCMIDDVAQTCLHLQLQPLTRSARQVPPIDNTLSALHPPPTAASTSLQQLKTFARSVNESRPPGQSCQHALIVVWKCANVITQMKMHRATIFSFSLPSSLPPFHSPSVFSFDLYVVYSSSVASHGVELATLQHARLLECSLISIEWSLSCQSQLPGTVAAKSH